MSGGKQFDIKRFFGPVDKSVIKRIREDVEQGLPGFTYDKYLSLCKFINKKPRSLNEFEALKPKLPDAVQEIAESIYNHCPAARGEFPVGIIGLWGMDRLTKPETLEYLVYNNDLLRYVSTDIRDKTLLVLKETYTHLEKNKASGHFKCPVASEVASIIADVYAKLAPLAKNINGILSASGMAYKMILESKRKKVKNIEIKAERLFEPPDKSSIKDRPQAKAASEPVPPKPSEEKSTKPKNAPKDGRTDEQRDPVIRKEFIKQYKKGKKPTIASIAKAIKSSEAAVRRSDEWINRVVTQKSLSIQGQGGPTVRDSGMDIELAEAKEAGLVKRSTDTLKSVFGNVDLDSLKAELEDLGKGDLGELMTQIDKTDPELREIAMAQVKENIASDPNNAAQTLVDLAETAT